MKNLQLLKRVFLYCSILLVLSCSKEVEENPPISPPILEEEESTTQIKLVADSFNGMPLVIVGDQIHNFMVAFQSTLTDGTVLSFEAVQDQLPIVMQDNEGNQWSVFGEAIEGTRKGQKLPSVSSYIGYWFSWATFYPGIEIHEGESRAAPPNEVGTGDWLVPSSLVLNGGPGKDGIPALENPEFLGVDAIDYVKEEDLVIGFKSGNTVRAYPHSILDWHEIINDEVGQTEIAITYCPLTGTGIGWDRNVGGNLTTFGVSGRLYNTNLIPYDRATDSNWSQMRLDCINGALQGAVVETHQVVETTWATWKKMYPISQVVTTNTGHNRVYGSYPYVNRDGEDYRVADGYLIFPITYDDDRLPRKERVLGVIVDGKAKAYRFDLF